MWTCTSVDAASSMPGMPAPTSVAIGVFDGVHLGHRALLDEAIRHRPAGGQAIACTFDPHPKAVLRPEHAPRAIVSVRTRCALFEEVGLDGTLIHPFSKEAASESARDFVERVLVHGLQARHVIVGEGFVFAHKRSGTVDVLRALGKEHQFAVHAHPPVTLHNEVVSSSRIREALASGDLSAANRWLGAPYRVRGTVVTGDKRGRTLGFPTANVSTDTPCFLPYGVYAARAVLPDESSAIAAVSIGVHPTFESAKATKVEAYLLDVESPDLYGQAIDLHLHAHIRTEARFDSASALIAQMHRDVEAIRNYMQNAHL